LELNLIRQNTSSPRNSGKLIKKGINFNFPSTAAVFISRGLETKYLEKPTQLETDCWLGGFKRRIKNTLNLWF